MNNKIQLNFNYALLLSFAIAMHGCRPYRETMSTLLIKYEDSYPLLPDRHTAFIPIIVLKKNL
uniref:hypothetical protein n=1 Tax=Pyropia dentata TaxID=76160 RepID=UPI00286AF03E|nr:hypothetical protein RMC00_pgp165 [Neoporphyra dentata]WKD83781.1 hypothetical protein [Neoporphyra dentata]